MFINNIKALVVVLALALFVFKVAQPYCQRFMKLDGFARRRTVWIWLTTLGFLSPNYWIYLSVAFVVLLWLSTNTEENPVALFLLLLHVVPPFTQDLRIGGVGLFAVNHYRLMGLALLLPWAFRLFNSRDMHQPNRLALIDCLVLGYGLLQLFSLIPHETITSTMRRTLTFAIDVWIPYYVISRYCRNVDRISDALAAFCLAAAIHAPIAAFEALRMWPLYNGQVEMWQSAGGIYLMRGDSLRAQSSAGHPLGFGYLMAMGFGAWLHLRTRITEKWVFVAGAACMWLGLVAAYSRSPWIVAIFAYFVYLLLGRNGILRALRALALTTLAGAALLFTPVGEKIVATLPFVGTVDASTVEYRQILAEASWQLIKLNPWFGNPLVLQDMEDVRAIQGEGIVDLVNTFATIALFYGGVGLALFLGPLLIGLKRTFVVMRRSNTSHESASIGAVLIACTVGTLLMMSSGSFGTTLAVMTWVLVGLMAAYSCTPQGVALFRREPEEAHGERRTHTSNQSRSRH